MHNEQPAKETVKETTSVNIREVNNVSHYMKNPPDDIAYQN